MLGLMQQRPSPSRTSSIAPSSTSDTRRSSPPRPTGESTSIADWAQRVRRLATVLDTLDVSADGRVGTFCWNTGRHLELYMAAPCTGRVLHTLNIRLFPEQLTYIVNHAADEVVFVDRSLLPVLWPLSTSSRRSATSW